MSQREKLLEDYRKRQAQLQAQNVKDADEKAKVPP